MTQVPKSGTQEPSRGPQKSRRCDAATACFGQATHACVLALPGGETEVAALASVFALETQPHAPDPIANAKDSRL